MVILVVLTKTNISHSISVTDTKFTRLE